MRVRTTTERRCDLCGGLLDEWPGHDTVRENGYVLCTYCDALVPAPPRPE